MRVRYLWMFLGLLPIILGACRQADAVRPISPAEDKLTFLFFFTEG